MKRTFSILICVIFAIALLASCSSYSPSDSESAGTPPAGGSNSPRPGLPEAPAPNAPSTGSGSGSGTPGSGSSTPQDNNSSEESVGSLPILTPSQAGGRKMSYTVTMYLQTTSFIPGMRTLLDAVSDTGGFLEDANIRGRDMREPETERSADFSFRVPSEQLTELLVLVENNYNLWSLRQTTTDSTENYQRADNRLEDLRKQEARLLEDLREPGITAEERLALEQRLAQAQITISDLISQQSLIDYNLNYSTVIVYLYEVIFPEIVEEEEVEEEVPPTFGERFKEAVLNSVLLFVTFCQWLAIVIVAIAPVLLILVILAAIALLVYRIVTKILNSRKQDKTTNSTGEQNKE